MPPTSQPDGPIVPMAQPNIAPETPLVVEQVDPSRYGERTERLKAIAQLLKAMAPLVWGIVILIVVVPIIGRGMLSNSPSLPSSSSKSEIAVVHHPDWAAIDQSVADAMIQAHNTAENYAATALVTWKTERLVPRVDRFLDWYFGYFNQKKFELAVPYLWLKNQVLRPFSSTEKMESVTDQITQQFEHEFAKQVLLPSLAQITLERITQETTDHYMAQLQSNIQTVQQTYQIPQGEWERYLDGLSITVVDTEGNTISNSLRSVALGGGGYLVTKPLLAFSLAKISSKFGAKAVGTATTKVAAKTGGAVAAEFGASVLDPLAGIALLVWDVWDYKTVVAADRPILRDNLMHYLDEMTEQLLHHPETSVMAAVDQLEAQLYHALAIAHPS
ncbi:MAG: hypothetical protein F6K30_20920 [Cyanothece sp. SIO2G6]|nr:hypothetical protein [Cyanothece sp. SIO2G6]